MNCKGFGRKRSCHNWDITLAISGGSEETHEKPVMMPLCPGRDSIEHFPNTSPSQISNSGHPARSQSLYWLTYPDTLNVSTPTDITTKKRNRPITVAARLNTGIVGSNPTQDMDICLYSEFVLSRVGTGLATDWSPVQGDLASIYEIQISELLNSDWAQTKKPHPST
jgi:hypothetical protein